jgi:hypothetical protein
MGIVTADHNRGGGQSASRIGGEGGVNFSFLLGREKTGGESLRVAVAGEAIIRKRWWW